LIQPDVENVLLATIHLKSQTQARASVSTDQWLTAAADRRDHQMDTNAKTAQLDSSNTLKIQRDVSDQLAVDNIKSNFQLIRIAVELVKLANGHNSSQMHKELNACKDHLLLATA
jgi:hypothetical protein